MIARLKRLFRAIDAPEPEPGDEIEQAAAALLAIAALGDDDLAAEERAAIVRLLGERFHLAPEAAAALAAAAEREARAATQLVRFTRVIKDRYSMPERIALIEMIWEVVLADGVLSAYEDSLLRRIAGLLYVSDRDRGAARRRALARSKASGG